MGNSGLAVVGGGEPWDRLPDEPAEKYDAFLEYLRQDPGSRNFAQIRRSHKVTYKNRDRWAWDRRAQAFDLSLGERKLENITEKKALAAQRQADIGAEMQELARDRLLAYKEHGGTITAMEAARIAEIGARLERLALGEPTENVMQTKQSLEAFVLRVETVDSKNVTD